jgi:hypothetical protein
MKGIGVQRKPVSRERPADLEPFERLIELQKQIIELVERNADAKRECLRLRAQLDHETEKLFRSTQGIVFRLRRGAARLFKRRPEIRPEIPPAYRPDLKLLPAPRYDAQDPDSNAVCIHKRKPGHN